MIRFCIDSDLPEIFQILDSQQYMYGVDISEKKPLIKQRLIELVVNSSTTQGLVGAFIDSKLVGFVAVILYKDFPFWRTTLLFFNLKLSASPKLMMSTGAALLEFMVKYAERHDRYEFFYVVRDSGRIRHQAVVEQSTYITERYDVNDLQVIQPKQIPSMVFYKDLLGITCGINEKPVVIRQGILKTIHRKDVWSIS